MNLKNFRRNLLVLSANGYAPLDFWLKMPLYKIRGWQDANDDLLKEGDKK